MNPAQFNNMAGMGRGMPNMGMMQNMNMGMAMNNNPQNMAQQRAPQYLQFIYQTLSQSTQADGPFSGWRAGISQQERAGQIKILFDSLRMLGSDVNAKRSLDIAIAFERKQFMQSSSHDQYKQAIHDKLSSIRDQRQQQANGAAANNPMANNNPGMMGFPQMTGMNPNLKFQQQQQQQQPGQPSGMMQPQMQPQQTINPNQAINQSMHAGNSINQAPRPNPPELTKEDNTWINTRAAEMAKSTPRDQMSKIVDNMDPRVRQSLQEKNIDPIIYHFRMKATKEFRMQQAQGRAQNIVGMGMNHQQNAFQSQTIQNTQNNPPNFMGNPDVFKNVQEEGMRQQQEGQLVVPASNPGQSVITPEMLRQKREIWARQYRQSNPAASEQEAIAYANNQIRQLQAQLAARNMQPGMMGQNVGQNPNLMQAQQSRMNVLNRPFEQPQANDSPAQNNSRPQSRPQPGQMMQNGQQVANLPSIQHIQQQFGSFPPQLQNALRSRPQSEWPKLAMQFRQRMIQQNQAKAQAQAQQQAQAAAAAQNQPHQVPPTAQMPQQAMARSASQQMNPQQTPFMNQMPKPQLNGPSAMQASLSTGAESTAGMMGLTQSHMPQQPNMNANNQNMMRMQQQQLQAQQRMQQQAGPQQQQQQQAQRPQFNEAVIRDTDNMVVPPQLRQRVAQAYQTRGINVPDFQTWHQMKEFLKTQAEPVIPMRSILQLQLQMAGQLRPGVAGGAPAQQLQQQNPNVLQAPPMLQQGSGPGQQPRQITPQDVQAAKRSNQTWAQLTDVQVQQLLEQQQQNRPQMRQNMTMPGSNQVPGAIQAQNAAKAAAMQQRNNQQQQQQQQQQLQQPQQTQPTRPISQNQSLQGAQGPKPADSKGVKRPNQDDAVTDSVPQSNKLTQPGLTREQFEKLAPAEKEAYTARVKQQQAVTKVQRLVQELDSSMKRPPPMMNMDPASKERIRARLSSDPVRRILERYDNFLIAVAESEPEQVLKNMIQQKLHLTAQFKPGTSWSRKNFDLADNFSLTPENLEVILTNIQRKFAQVQQNRQQKQMERAAAINGQQNSMPLTAENLDMASKQAAQQPRPKGQKSKEGPPPAPTTEKAPLQFPLDRGQGTPKYGNPGLKQEDLKLPPKKKQRGNDASSPVTPVQAAQPKPVLRCPVPGCNTQPQGFNTPAELTEHRNTVHVPDEAAIKDVGAYIDASLQQAFNVDENFQPKAMAKPMQKTASQASKASVKMETPPPMSRIPSQRQGKAISQKGLSSGQDMTTQQSQDAQAIQQAWADSNFTYTDLSNVFGPSDAGDVIPLHADSKTLRDKTFEAYMKTEDYKRIFGEVDNTSSEGSSNKSKSPDQGSEPSLPTTEKAQAQIITNPFEAQLDFSLDGMELPTLEGNFDDMFVGDTRAEDWQMIEGGDTGSLSPWEKIDNTDAGLKQDDFEFGSWIRDPGDQKQELVDQLTDVLLNEPFDWDTQFSLGDERALMEATMI